MPKALSRDGPYRVFHYFSITGCLLNQSFRKSVFYQPGGVLDRHLVHDRGTLILNSAFAEIKPAGNLLHGELFAYQPDDLQLTPGELGRVTAAAGSLDD